MNYEAVFWDIGGVIVELESVREGYAAFLGELTERYEPDVEAPLKTWKSTLGEHFKAREGTEYRTAREGYRTATDALFDDPLAEDEWRPLFEKCTAETLRPEPNAVETVRRLREAGLYLGIVSDIDTREAEKMLSAFDVRQAFDGVTTSEAVGYTKPDARMFDAALAEADVDPADGVMVGDRYRHDVEGAKDAGLDAVAYGEEAAGPRADYEIDDLSELLGVVGVRG